MNAGDFASRDLQARTLASVLSLVRQYFPAAKPNLRPWRDDPQTQLWNEKDTLDVSFHFPGWSQRLQCSSLLLQLSFQADVFHPCSLLLGVLIRGMTFDGERWRLVTLGDWSPEGLYLPQTKERDQLRQICRELFELFDGAASLDTPA